MVKGAGDAQQRAKAGGPLRAWGERTWEALGGPAPQGGAGPYGLFRCWLPALAGMEKDAALGGDCRGGVKAEGREVFGGGEEREKRAILQNEPTKVL